MASRWREMNTIAATEIDFDADSHSYRVAGRQVPGVTSILAANGLIDSTWFNEASRWRGTAAHLACQFDDESDLKIDSVPAEVRGHLEGWRKFRSDTGFVPIYTEKRVWSPEGFCGTPDRIGMLGGRPSIIDLKTSASAYPWVGLQLAGYAIGAAPLMDTHPGAFQRIAVCLNGDGGYSATHFKDRRDIEVFRAAVVMAAWKKEHAK